MSARDLPRIQGVVDGLRARIKDPARQEILVQLGVELAHLQTLALANVDVSREMAHLKSQASSLTASETGVLTDVLMTWVSGVAGGVVRGVLVAAAGG
ncbi:MAG: hypothetical protein RJA36_810 [Pseudomonadota bacterium]